MWYAFFILCGFLALLLLVRLRLRIDFSESKRLLFIGLGQTGPEFDFFNHTRTFRLFGIALSPKPLHRATSPTPAQSADSTPQPRRARRSAPISAWLPLIPDIFGSVLSFVAGLLRSVIIEECAGAIRASAPSPDQTGQLFGCYCALAGAVPAIGAHLSFEPDWLDGPSFSGTVRFSAALPLYALLYRVLILLWSLPLWQLYRLSRLKPKGVPYAQ